MEISPNALDPTHPTELLQTRLTVVGLTIREEGRVTQDAEDACRAAGYASCADCNALIDEAPGRYARCYPCRTGNRDLRLYGSLGHSHA